MTVGTISLPVSKSFVYLASKSPRRQELLTQIGVAFEVFLPVADENGDTVDESHRSGEVPAEYVARLARSKAEYAWQALVGRKPLHPLLAADTTVAMGNTVYGKPDSRADAARMLSELSDRTHCVYTAVALAWAGNINIALSCSNVTMRGLRPSEIERYVETGEPMDKAGAYAVQGRAAVFIQRIEGSYSGVMGLPLFETADLLARAGLVLP